MPAADANRTSLLIVAESQFGVTPATPNMSFLRNTGESLRLDTQTTVSQEIRSDRQVTDVVRVGIQAAGDINWELSYGAQDALWKAALLSAAWGSPVSLSSLTLTIVASAGTITRSTGSFISDGVVVGMWFKLGGLSNSANNNYFKVASLTATVITVQQVSASTRLVDEGPTASCTLYQGAQIVNGTTLETFTIERRYNDLSGVFAGFTGMAPDRMQMSVTKDGIVTGSFGMIGKTELPTYASTLANSTTAAPTEKVMNCVDDVKLFTEGGGVSYRITDFNWQVTNNLRARLECGTLGAESLGLGSFNASGTTRAYFRTKDAYDRYINYGSSEQALALIKNGKGYIIDFPQVRYTGGQRVAGGINTDIIADINWTAEMHATELVTMRVQRFQ